MDEERIVAKKVVILKGRRILVTLSRYKHPTSKKTNYRPTATFLDTYQNMNREELIEKLKENEKELKRVSRELSKRNPYDEFKCPDCEGDLTEKGKYNVYCYECKQTYGKRFLRVHYKGSKYEIKRKDKKTNSEKKVVRYSEDMKKFIESHLHFDNEDLTEALNKEFGCDFKKHSVACYISRKGLKRGMKKLKKKVDEVFTDDKIEIEVDPEVEGLGEENDLEEEIDQQELFSFIDANFATPVFTLIERIQKKFSVKYTENQIIKFKETIAGGF